MAQSPRASGPVLVPPKWKRDFVTQMAENNGLQRVMDEDGNPMLIKPGQVKPQDLEAPYKKRSKVIGPQASTLAIRG